jgi:hypothetical protein
VTGGGPVLVEAVGHRRPGVDRRYKTRALQGSVMATRLLYQNGLVAVSPRELEAALAMNARRWPRCDTWAPARVDGRCHIPCHVAAAQAAGTFRTGTRRTPERA